MLDKYDDHNYSIYTGKVYMYFRKFKRVNRSDHGRGANECHIKLENKSVQCYKANGNGRFLKFLNCIFKKDFSLQLFEFINSYKRRTNVMTRSRIPEFRERYKIGIGINDLKSTQLLSRTVKRRDIFLYIHENLYYVFWKTIRRDSLLNGVEETERNFKDVKNKIKENKLVQRIGYSFRKHETVDQLETCLYLI